MELIKKERYLSVDKMAEIYAAFGTLNQMLAAINLPTATLTDSTVTYNISPAVICDKMNAVEENIQALHCIADGKISNWEDKYYKSFIWSPSICDIKTEVDRWIDWINNFYAMLSNVKIEYIPLYYTDDSAVYTSDGHQLCYIKRIYEVN